MSKVIEEYLEYVESIAGDDGSFYKISESDEPILAVVSYQNVPESGYLTAFSFGLSSATVKEWTDVRPELVISVKSQDVAWALAMGELIRNAKGREHVFSWGMILDFTQPISDESSMTAFLLFECTVLDEEDLKVRLSDRTVLLSQIYPIYDDEIPFIEKIGAQRFLFDLEIDFFDVARKPVLQLMS